jgi:hypothetical protein
MSAATPTLAHDRPEKHELKVLGPTHGIRNIGEKLYEAGLQSELSSGFGGGATLQG